MHYPLSNRHFCNFGLGSQLSPYGGPAQTTSIYLSYIIVHFFKKNVRILWVVFPILYGFGLTLSYIKSEILFVRFSLKVLCSIQKPGHRPSGARQAIRQLKLQMAHWRLNCMWQLNPVVFESGQCRINYVSKWSWDDHASKDKTRFER